MNRFALLLFALCMLAVMAADQPAKAETTPETIALGFEFELRGLTEEELARDGIPIREVNENGMADLAGIRAGDRLIGLDGTRFRNSDDAARRLTAIRDGETVTFDITRDGDVLAISSEAFAVRDYLIAMFLVENPELTAETAMWGIEFDMESASNETLGVKGIRLDINPYGSGAAAGLRTGDRLYGIDGRPFADGHDADARLGAKRVGDAITFEIVRGGRRLSASGYVLGPHGIADHVIRVANGTGSAAAATRSSGGNGSGSAMLGLALFGLFMMGQGGAPAQGCAGNALECNDGYMDNLTRQQQQQYEQNVYGK